MCSSSNNTLRDKLTQDQLNVALYIYVGQNIRDMGILKQDPFLKRNSSTVQFLLEQEIAEEWSWYKFDVFRISYRFTVQIREIMEENLEGEKERLRSMLQSIPDNLLSFFVFDYLSYGLSFPVRKDWLFDWRDTLLENRTIKKHKSSFFTALMDLGFCVKTRNYVSTRGGELRDSEYVISAEVRKFLEEIATRRQFPSSFKDLAIIHWLIREQIEYRRSRTVEVTIKDESLAELGSTPEAIKDVLDDFLNRLGSANAAYEVTKTIGLGTQIRADRTALLHFSKTDIQEQIIKPLISEKVIVPKEEIEEEADFLRLVRNLIDRKFSVYTTAAQFSGKEIFKSLPYIERCVLDLIIPRPGEEGLQRFVGDLHQVLEESSTKEILKFREGDYTSLEEWLEIEIPSEASSFYDDAKAFFRDLNRLRNFYSHSVDARGIFEAGLIFSRLIGKYYPEKDDITKTEIVLLERSTRALQGLERALRIAWRKKMGT